MSVNKKKKKEILEWCSNCSKYTLHIRTAPNILKCKKCGHEQWAAWAIKFNEE